MSQIPEPPTAEMEFARIAMADARNMKADQYSPARYRQALAMYDSAMQKWSVQNKKFIIRRNYCEVVSLARKSAEYSGLAVKDATANSISLKTRIKGQIDILEYIVSNLNSLFARYPLPADIRHRITRGKLLLSEATAAFREGSLVQAERKINDAGPLLRYSWDHAIGSLNDYFSQHSLWVKWMNETIRESAAKSGPAIIIDKFAGRCYFYQKGVRVAEFEAELGAMWTGHKRYRGDKATPEGMYHVVKKLEAPATKYYKALLINYPNEDDVRRFREGVKNGTLTSADKIGGMIEIHGHGGKGNDWTEGCIAIINKDMDWLYRQVSIGTPVTIIGSAASLEEIKKRGGVND